jgi:hypothetical protein
VPEFIARFAESATIDPQSVDSGLSEVISGFLEACEFTSNDYDQEPSEWEGAESWSPQARQKAAEVCNAFRNAAGADYEAVKAHMDETTIGHNVWYDAVGAGVGFWDRDLPNGLGERLSEAVKKACPYIDSAYVGDDGQLYV